LYFGYQKIPPLLNAGHFQEPNILQIDSKSTPNTHCPPDAPKVHNLHITLHTSFRIISLYIFTAIPQNQLKGSLFVGIK
jgi:hypothetical protein